MQRRSREAWGRVLDAGVALLEEGGYEAVTISAICNRAGVAPRAIYARAASKDALFLAVYEHGMQRIRADNLRFTEQWRWRDLTAPDLIERAIRDLAEIFRRHGAFLRPVVLISGVQPAIQRQGARYSRELGSQITGLLLQARNDIDHGDPEAATWAIFNTVFSTLSMRTVYGPGFVAPAEHDEKFVAALSSMAQRYLLGR